MFIHTLGILESVLGINTELGQTLVSKTKILPWLLKRIEAKNHDGNRVYAAEILSILLDNRPNRLVFGKVDGVETTLKVLSVSYICPSADQPQCKSSFQQYRRRDPVDADEEEFMENVFDALCAALSEPEVKTLYLEAEGVDLMLLMMK